MEKIESIQKQLLTAFPVRKTAAQKREFREWLVRQLRKMGYAVDTETYGMGTTNVVAGRPETAELLFTAHWERQGRTYTRVIRLDEEQRKNELARITGGSRITPALLQSAGELLHQAETYKEELEHWKK